MKKVVEPQSLAQVSVLSNRPSADENLSSSMSNEKPTPLLLLDFISLKLNPKPISKLVSEDSPKKNFCNWASEALIESHLSEGCQL